MVVVEVEYGGGGKGGDGECRREVMECRGGGGGRWWKRKIGCELTELTSVSFDDKLLRRSWSSFFVLRTLRSDSRSCGSYS